MCCLSYSKSGDSCPESAPTNVRTAQPGGPPAPIPLYANCSRRDRVSIAVPVPPPEAACLLLRKRHCPVTVAVTLSYDHGYWTQVRLLCTCMLPASIWIRDHRVSILAHWIASRKLAHLPSDVIVVVDRQRPPACG